MTILSPQKIPVHCMNEKCASRFSDTYFVDSLEAPCPGCGERKFLYPCDAVHLVVESLTGPLPSKITGLRYNFACDLARKAYNYGLKHPGFPIHATMLEQACNCPDCLKRVGYQLTPDHKFTNTLVGS